MTDRQGLANHLVRILDNRMLAGDYGWLTLFAPALAKVSQPGHFVHVHCGPGLTLRRPFSLFDADAQTGVVDILYRVVGQGTALLSQRQPGETLDLVGPIGQPFAMPDETHALLLGGGVGLAPVHFLARRLTQKGQSCQLLLGLEGVLPFPMAACGLLPDGTAAQAPAAMVAHGLDVRVASLTPRAGVFQGFVTDLAVASQRDRPCRVFACGPVAMLKAVANLGWPGQVSLEAHMACGFGGCAGCVAPIRNTGEGWSYRRVCVDGPVFEVGQVAWDLV